ncbi:MAG TPA: integrase core domain-containing protein [Ktedonobacteraceae bacterium]|nr:integrase core domain-containing protein [Ktedonobacteraceae bacterium]
MAALLFSLKRRFQHSFSRVRQRVLQWTRPTSRSLFVGTLNDLARTRAELIAENALLRQQLVILHRQVKRPTCTRSDRLLLVVLARGVRNWKQALFLVQPDTLLGWHRQAFRWFWRCRSKPATTQPRVAAETITLIKTMARDNRLWGAERIRGELLKLGIHVSKRTIQKYMRHQRARPSSQTWSTFLHNHAHEIWACDFLPVTDLFFRSLYAFFIIELQSRKVMHVGVTRHPTDAWGSQQLREATPYGQAPRFLIHDNDAKFGQLFDTVASGTGIELLRTPYRAPRANAYCERFLGSVRRECLDHLLILHEQHLSRVLQAYVAYFNQARPHQGLQQQIPDPSASALPADARDGPIRAVPVLGGLHHDYCRAA